MNIKRGQQVLGKKKIRMNMCQQVFDEVIMTSRDISEKHTSQNVMHIKLGQQLVDKKKIQISMWERVPDDTIMTSYDFS